MNLLGRPREGGDLSFELNIGDRGVHEASSHGHALQAEDLGSGLKGPSQRPQQGFE